MKRKRMGRAGALIAAAALLLLLAGTVLASAAGPDIPRYVIGGGGGYSEAGNFALDATAGQAVAGAVSARGFDLCTGFWCRTGEYRVRLPLVLRY